MGDTYSFSECSLVLTHPDLGVLTVTGKGVGDISISMTGDRTSMEPAADGVVAISKIKDPRATATVRLQQTSDASRELLRWYNYLEGAPASQWAKTKGILKSPTTHEQHNMNGVAFQKLPDSSYAAQQGMNAWALMIADCQRNPI